MLNASNLNNERILCMAAPESFIPALNALIATSFSNLNPYKSYLLSIHFIPILVTNHLPYD